MPSPKLVGERSEAIILARLLLAGKVVLQPFGDSQRYDLVTEENGVFTRIQCKTGRVRKGVVEFNTCSSHYHRGKGWKDYIGQADVFGVYVPELDRVYMVPVTAVPTQGAFLRLEPPKNGQTQGIRFAADYEFKPT